MRKSQKRGKPGPKPRPAELKMIADVRIKMTPRQKKQYQLAAKSNGYGHLATWFRDCALDRMAQLRQQGKLPVDVIITNEGPKGLI